VREAWISERMPEEQRALRRAQDIVRRSLRRTRLEPHDILGVEHRFRAETVDGWRVAGAADLVIRTGPQSIEIRDHKVTRQHNTPGQLANDFQLNLYGWLARREWPWVDQITIAHHYPLGGELVRVDLDDTHADAAIARLRSVATRAAADTTYEPAPGEHCASCVWAHLCPAE
jgi:CRISPR/Cas system-associated exonuclease Cas4 (RecB family)